MNKKICLVVPTLSKVSIPFLALLLSVSLTVDSFAAAVAPDSCTVDTSMGIWFNNSNADTITPGIAPTNSWSSSWSSFSSLPSSGAARFYIEGTDVASFPGGQGYQFYWTGTVGGSGFFSVGDCSDDVFYDISYSILCDGHIYEYVNRDSDSVNVLVDGVLKSFYTSTGTSWIPTDWYVDSGNLRIAFNSGRTYPVTLASDISTCSYGRISSYYYSSLDSVSLSFSNISGSIAGAYEYELPETAFSITSDGYYKVNASFNLPFDNDYDPVCTVNMNFSSPDSGSITTLSFSIEDFTYGGLGTTDATGEQLEAIGVQLESIAQAMADLAKDSTVGQCLSAIHSILSFISGDMYALMREMETNQDTLLSFLQSNMLPTLVTQLSNIKASIDSGFEATVDAIEAQTAALIAYLESAFGQAGTDIDQSGDKLEGAIGSYDDAESGLTDGFSSSWDSFDFGNFDFSSGLGGALTWVSTQWTSLYNSLGSDVQMIIVIPAVLGVSLMLISGTSRVLGRRR